MVDLLLEAITSLGSEEVQKVLVSAGESVIKKYKDSHTWRKMLVETGEFFIQNEQDETQFFKDLALVLSKNNLSEIAKDLQSDDGYDLKHKLYNSIMQLMRKYDIPYEIAESYTMRIIYAILYQIRTINPEKYEHFFLQEWKDEQERNFSELQNRIDKISHEIMVYNHEQIAISSSGQIDVDIRRSTQNPSIGIEFFIVDDERFQKKFQDQRYKEIIYIKGRNREETIYCVLNELWRLNDKRPIYVVKSLESWNKLLALRNEENIYIPWFYADEIVAIENNTNIFVIDENTPVFSRDALELRPRTRDTLLRCLKEAGMEYNKAYALLEDTHGLYAQIKKKLFRGEYLKSPSWITGVSEKAQKTCLLIGSWEEIEGDKLIIESIYGGTYEDFIEEVIPYVKGDDQLLHRICRNNSTSYYLASIENIWSYLDVLPNEPIWQSFTKAVFDVIIESEDLFTYDSREALIAQFKGERLFWSETIRKGMLKTLLMKGAYKKNEEIQQALDRLVEKILTCIKTEKQWIYIARFWRELCEISPTEILKRLENEFTDDTGLLSLFENQSSDFLFGKNAYIDILWGVEKFLVQKDYFWQAFRWLLKLDALHYEYKSNSPQDIFSKVFCIWMNFSALQTSNEKITAAEIAFEADRSNTWDYLISAIDNNGRSIVGELSYPKYREHETRKATTIVELQKTYRGYFDLLLQNMDFLADRWINMINLSSNLPKELCLEVIEQLLSEIGQMTEEDVLRVKNGIRYLISRHRLFASSEWAMSEELLIEYEQLLNRIKLNKPEFEYSYLFTNNHNGILLHPVPYQHKEESKENETAIENLIQAKLIEFQNCGYDMTLLAMACAQESFSSLGRYLAKYWNNGKWDYESFKRLLTAQESGVIAIEYLECCGNSELIPYEIIIEDLLCNSCSIEILAKVYRVEAFRTKSIPLITNASEAIKKEFWKYPVHCDACNEEWALIECKKYALLNVYLEQMHYIHYNRPLSADQILECLDGIENMPRSDGTQMTSYHVEQLIKVIQEAFFDNAEKSIRVSHIELFFVNILDWKDMKCFQRMISQSPDLFALLIAVIFKKDNENNTTQLTDQTYYSNIYRIYDKAHFCPTESKGRVNDEQLENWIVKYRQLLTENDQASLFSYTLGRLLSFSPLGIDGHEPCEAVRKMIEKYGDEKMINSFQAAVYNRRDVFSPSAGKEEHRMAEEFRNNAYYLEPHYPKTAKIFYGLYETYMRESSMAREDAENGW